MYVCLRVGTRTCYLVSLAKTQRGRLRLEIKTLYSAITALVSFSSGPADPGDSSLAPVLEPQTSHTFLPSTRSSLAFTTPSTLILAVISARSSPTLTILTSSFTPNWTSDVMSCTLIASLPQFAFCSKEHVQLQIWLVQTERRDELCRTRTPVNLSKFLGSGIFLAARFCTYNPTHTALISSKRSTCILDYKR